MEDNFSALSSMIYSGRGITVGMTPEGNPFVGYTLTGRSPSSQARRLIKGDKTDIVRTELVEDDETLIRMFNIQNEADLSKLKSDIAKGSRALIVYPAIMPVGSSIVVSNGAQTKLLYNVARNTNENPMIVFRDAFSKPFYEYDEKGDKLIDITTYEPDSPNFTPRISACLGDKLAGIYIVKKRLYSEERDDDLSKILLTPGEARGITTYSGGNENPLAPFKGELLYFNIDSNDPQEICHNLYNAIGNPNPNDNNKVYRVAAAVMMKKKDGGLTFAVMNRADEGVK
jgi:IMP cyclohydrolase